MRLTRQIGKFQIDLILKELNHGLKILRQHLSLSVASEFSIRDLVPLKSNRFDKELAKKVVKIIKETRIKVQSAIQGDQVRVTGKKLDDLQSVIAMLKNEKSIEIPLQFNNFRD
jgi:uncharacterized protein YajQ (UPF0234 family)